MTKKQTFGVKISRELMNRFQETFPEHGVKTDLLEKLLTLACEVRDRDPDHHIVRLAMHPKVTPFMLASFMKEQLLELPNEDREAKQAVPSSD